MPDDRISIKIDPALKAAVRAYADSRYRTITSIVVQALESYLKDRTTPVTNPKNNDSTASP